MTDSAATDKAADDANRAKLISDLQKIVADAYEHRRIASVHNGDGVTFTIHIPHVSEGPTQTLFRFAANVAV
jgi:hypothetical protein